MASVVGDLAKCEADLVNASGWSAMSIMGVVLLIIFVIFIAVILIDYFYKGGWLCNLCFK